MATEWCSWVDGLPSDPRKDAELMKGLGMCSPNPLRLIESVLSESTCLPTQEDTNAHPAGSSGDSQSFGNRRSSSLQMGAGVAKVKACALYTFALRSLVSFETIRLGTTDHGNLLHQEGLHRALLAICLDCIVKAKSLLVLSFPWAMEQARATSFDILLLADSFRELIPALPATILEEIEEIQIMLLESRAWRSTEPLLQKILEDKANCWPKNTIPAFAKIHGKLLNLASERVVYLSKRLYLSKDVCDQIWTILKYCLDMDPLLLKNRHLDSIIICSIYITCKMLKSSHKQRFKTLLEAYKLFVEKDEKRRHWLHDHTATKDVELDYPGSKGTVIDFYNAVFVPRTKGYVLEFKSLTEQQDAIKSVRTPGDAHRLLNEATAGFSTLGSSSPSRIPGQPAPGSVRQPSPQKTEILPTMSQNVMIPVITPLPGLYKAPKIGRFTISFVEQKQGVKKHKGEEEEEEGNIEINRRGLDAAGETKAASLLVR